VSIPTEPMGYEDLPVPFHTFETLFTFQIHHSLQGSAKTKKIALLASTISVIVTPETVAVHSEVLSLSLLQSLFFFFSFFFHVSLQFN